MVIEDPQSKDTLSDMPESVEDPIETNYNFGTSFDNQKGNLSKTLITLFSSTSIKEL
jgi:hypothetical protein